MPSILERANNLRNNFRRITNQSPEQAIIGDANGVMKYDTTPPSHVECRVYTSNGLSGPRPIYLPSNVNVTLRPGTPVLVGYKYGRECILDPNTSAQLASGLDSTTAVAAQQSASAPQGGLSTLKCIASTPPDLFVHLQGWNPIVDGVYFEMQGLSDIDISGALPASGEMCFALIAVLPDFSGTEVVTSAPRGVNDDPLDQSDVNEALLLMTLGSTVVLALYVIGDQVTISQANIDQLPSRDLRQLVNTAQNGGGTELALSTYVLIQDQKSAGTQGGTFTAGSWQTRDLNTVVADSGSLVTLATNQFTPDIGTYIVKTRAPAYSCANHQCRIRNVTAGSTVIVGSPEFARAAGAGQSSQSFAEGVLIANGTDAFEVQHQCDSTKTTDGFGTGANFGEVMVYTSLELIKVS